MFHYQLMNYLPLLYLIAVASCQSCISTSNEIPDNIITQESIMEASTHYDDFCDYFYAEGTLNDTLRFKFEDMEDYGPVHLSNDELEQIYCEIKRGNTEAYKILFDHYFYSYSNGIPRFEMDKLICMTDYLAQKYSYYRGYLACGNFIFECLTFDTDDYYAAKMISYYEMYFEVSHSKTLAKRLYEIFCGNYFFQDKDTVKANYYERFIIAK